MGGLVHFSNYFHYMESVEHAFLRSLGFSVHPRGQSLFTGWPRMIARCQYLSPLRFEDIVETHLLVEKKTRKSLTYQFRLTNQSDEPPLLAARGVITATYVTVDPDTPTKMRAARIPDEIFNRIDQAPGDLTAMSDESNIA
jgi:acyl-CoA thioester hydrolase